MHEMGIASSILDAVHKELHRYPKHRATRVGVRIGEYAGIDTESLRFCFDALVKNTDMAALELEIEQRMQSDELDLTFVEIEEAKGVTV